MLLVTWVVLMVSSSLNRKSFVGLALPATRTAGYTSSRSSEDRAYGDLLIALFTPRGSRPMDRTFGSTLSELLFEPDSGQQDDPTVAYAARDAVGRYVPQVRVGSIRVTVVDQNNRQGVLLTYSMASDPAGRSPGSLAGYPRPLPLPTTNL